MRPLNDSQKVITVRAMHVNALKKSRLVVGHTSLQLNMYHANILKQYFGPV